MNRRESERTISCILRRAIVESGLSHNALAQATGVTRASILRFVRGDQSLRLDKADLLAAHLGLTLTKQG
jgi:plasmid maintenance system antidote protein VapI